MSSGHTHVLSVLVENKPGVLARIAALFSRRGFNIGSLAVGPTEHDEISRMTVLVDADQLPLEQVTKQLNKLVEVLKVVELDPEATVERRILLVKVRADGVTRAQVVQTAELFRARVVDVALDSGRRKVGKTVVMAYLSQEVRELERLAGSRVIDAVSEVRQYTHLGDKEVSASQRAQRLGFTGSRQQSRVGDLSGGERRRLQLLRLLMTEPNVLILDEPTNDLDIETLTSLEDVLDGWAGTLLVVSHDRYLLERMCDRQVALLGDGRLRDLPGGVEQYLELRRQQHRAGQGAAGHATAPPAGAGVAPSRGTEGGGAAPAHSSSTRGAGSSRAARSVSAMSSAVRRRGTNTPGATASRSPRTSTVPTTCSRNSPATRRRVISSSWAASRAARCSSADSSSAKTQPAARRRAVVPSSASDMSSATVSILRVSALPSRRRCSAHGAPPWPARPPSCPIPAGAAGPDAVHWTHAADDR